MATFILSHFHLLIKPHEKTTLSHFQILQTTGGVRVEPVPSSTNGRIAKNKKCQKYFAALVRHEETMLKM